MMAVGRETRKILIDVDGFIFLVSANFAEPRVQSDSIEPAREGRFAAEVLNFFVNQHEGILHYLFGIRFVADKFQRLTVNAVRIAIENDVERAGVAGLQSFYNELIGRIVIQ